MVNSLQSYFSLIYSPKVEKSIVEVTSDYIQKRRGFENLVMRPMSKVLSWVDWWSGGLRGSALECKTLLGRASHALGWLDFPKGIETLGKSIVNLKDSLLIGAGWDVGAHSTEVYINTASSVGHVASAFTTAKNADVLSLSPGQIVLINFIGFMGSTALILSSLKGIKKQATILAQSEVGTPKFNLALLRLASKVGLLALGVFGVVTFLTGAVIEKLILLSLSTLLLLLSLIAHFYEKIKVDNDEKTVDV